MQVYVVKTCMKYAKHNALQTFRKPEIYVSHTSTRIIYNLMINPTKQIHN